jgi:hypothetical protein
LTIKTKMTWLIFAKGRGWVDEAVRKGKFSFDFRGFEEYFVGAARENIRDWKLVAGIKKVS